MNVGPFEFTNTVSGIVFGALLIVVAGLSWLARILPCIFPEQADAKDAALQAVQNTKNVSNGFAGDVRVKLDTIVDQNAQNAQAIDVVQKQLSDHLAWHLTQGDK